jgi:hypothetical protein
VKNDLAVGGDDDGAGAKGAKAIYLESGIDPVSRGRGGGDNDSEWGVGDTEDRVGTRQRTTPRRI